MKDLFSEKAGLYAKFRPLYPRELYEFIFGEVINFDAAWDAGTGNGQVARELARHFKEVLATDISEKQLSHATQEKNITYLQAAETLAGMPADHFDLVTVAQAFHWFDMEKFFTEVRRVARNNAILAIWGYGLMTVSPEVDALVLRFYNDVTGPYWDKERRYIDESYTTIPFPFQEIKIPPFFIQASWTALHLEGFLNSWSAVQHYTRANGNNPVDELMPSIHRVWEGTKSVRFPLFARIGRVTK
jgi:SAM-dependent methyltransferase